MPTYFVGDEAGHLSFSFDKGATRYLVMALVAVTEPDVVRDAIMAFRRTRGLPATFEFSFHGTTSTRLKTAFFDTAASLDFGVWAIVVDKPAVPNALKLMGYRAFYVFCLTELIQFIPLDHRRGAILLLDEFDRSGRTLADISRALRLRGVERGFAKLRARRSHSDSLIQLADMIAGALLRKYAREDDTFLPIVESKLMGVLEYPGNKRPPS